MRKVLDLKGQLREGNRETLWKWNFFEAPAFNYGRACIV
jgi:hypothetical protein